MVSASSDYSSQPPPLQTAGLPLRSPRTSLILAELARQRRWNRRQRRLERQERRRALAQVAASSRRFFEAICTPVMPGISCPEAMSLIALCGDR